MKLKRLGAALFIAMAAVLVLGVSGIHAETEIAKKFIEAFDANDGARMTAIVEENKARIPAEVKALIKDAGKTANADEREAMFYMAEMMARLYKDSTNDAAPLLEVKKKSFDARLTVPERPVPVDGVYIIELPKPAQGVKNVFRPNNIVVKKGSTVRWVNKDDVAHIFSSMPVIGKGGISSPAVEPGKSWERKFDQPGEYFYICFIHHAMVGKITVEE
ncbi:MAG: cupredoxin domain-containing protein [Deltaproteobacteria bacterium]|nr:cupredoxin domain-containing protein [Deltaproteobacteria bacterium]